jgi:hypothetical protein
MPDFASNSTYVGPLPEPSEEYEDGPTKVAMTGAQRANGFIPDQPIAAEHLNYELNALTAGSTSHAALIAELQHMAKAAALRLRLTGTNLPFTDAADSMAVIGSIAIHRGILAVKVGTNDTHVVNDGDNGNSNIGAVVSITSDVCGIARNGSRLVLIGTGGNRCCFSTNEGSSWSAGSDLGATPQAIIYNATHARFMVTFAAGVNVAQDVNGASTWASVSSGLTSAQGGIAHLSNGTAVVCGLDGSGDVDFARSTDGGGTWSTAGGTVPNAADYNEAGWVVGNGGTTLYHAGRALSGTQLRICSSTDGLTWTLVATLLPAASSTFDLAPRIFLCPDTGLLVVVCYQTHSDGAYASRDGGATWIGPAFYQNFSMSAYGVARGRLLATRSTRLYATDAIKQP